MKGVLSMIYIGIDVAKSKHDCFIVDSNGVVIQDNFTFENSLKGFNLFLSKVPNVDRQKMKVGLESTGHYSNNLIDFLLRENFPVTLFNPLSTNLYRKAQTLRKTKTDTVDARIIAKMLFTDECNSYSPISYHYQELKSLTRHRHRLVNYRSKLKISVSRLVDIAFPELPSLVWSIHQKSAYALLLEAATTDDIASLHLTKLVNLLKKNSKGKYGREKALAIREAAIHSIGSNRSAFAFELKQTIRLIMSVQEELTLLDKQLKTLMDEMSSPIVTIPGISFRLGSIILAEIGDITKFSSPAKLLAFAGLDPSTHQSGNYYASNARMVKRGSKYLRWALLQAARLVSMRVPEFNEYLHKKQNEGKHYNVALSHTAKKLIRVIFSLLVNNQSFHSK